METRRNFLKKTGALLGSALLSTTALGKEREEKKTKLNIKTDSSWDVVVVGGGPGGCTAAIAAAREGAKTLLIESTGQLGGMGTSGMVPSWTPFSDGEKIVYRGLAEKILNASRPGVPHEPKDKLQWVNINPEYLMKVYDAMVAEAGAKVLFCSRVAAVEKKSNDEVEAVIVANGNGLTAFKAKVFVDATGEGSLAHWAGAEIMLGDADGKVQNSSLCFSMGNVNMENYYKRSPMHGDNKKSPIHDIVRSGKYPLVVGHCCLNPVGPGVVQFNAGHIDADPTNPWEVSDALVLGRKIAEQYLQGFKEFVPDVFGDSFLVRTAALLGVRESRRVVGDYVFTSDDWAAKRTFPDEIGRNCYYIDVHKPGFKPVFYGKGDSHGIPYRCLTPRDLKNVICAGRCISTDEKAFGSLRIMPACLVTGEAAGMAAAHAVVQARGNVHAVDVDNLRRRLKQEGQYLL